MRQAGTNVTNSVVRFFLLFFFALLPFAAMANSFAQNGFFPSDNNAPGSFRKITDPTNDAPSRKVQSFNISANYCSQNKYQDGASSDCKWQSVRSMLVEDVWKRGVLVQPKEQWYSWYMFIDNNFPIGSSQVRGQYMFAEFHNGQCPHLAFINQTDEDNNLYLVTNRALGDYECAQVDKVRVLNLKDIRGRWVRFEMLVKWGEKDGLVEVYVDGEKTAELKGRNLTIGYTNINAFHYGIYLCCTAGVDKVQPATALFSNVSSAKVREKLK